MSVRTRVLLISILFLIPAKKIFATELFWGDLIQTAVLLRDSFNKNNGLDTLKQPISSVDLLGVPTQITNNENEALGSNPWYNFYTGIANKSLQDISFNHCLELSLHDPGTTWLLAIGFYKNGYTTWADRALRQLEKQMLESGAEQVTLISRQLLYKAIENQEMGNNEDAAFFYRWALNFGTQELRVFNRNAWFQFPHNINGFFDTISALLLNAFSSWKTQIHVLASVYYFLRLWFLVFVVLITSLLLIKYLPAALHRIGDLFPSTVPLAIKTVFSSVAFSSFIGFGLLPFLWCTTFVIYRYLSNQEKVLFSTVLLLLIAAPIDPHVQTIFSRSLNPEHSPLLFYRSVREGFSSGIFKKIRGQIEKKPHDHLLLLAATNLAIKNKDLASASLYAEMSTRLRPDDPVVLVTSANTAFLKGDISRAEKLYKQAIALDKNSPEAHYNTGQCHLRKFETTEGIEQINQAVALNPSLVNTFIKKNNLHFPDSVPFLRRIMFPDYSPVKFWSDIMFGLVYNGKSASQRWGTAMFGLSPWVSFFVSMLLLAIRLLFQFKSTENRVKKLFECNYCARKICKKCRRGSLCRACSDKIRFIHNEATQEKMRSEIIRRSKLIKRISALIVNMLLPGTGNLLQSTHLTLNDALLLVCTSLILGFYILIIQAPFYSSPFHEEYSYLLIIGLIYSSFFALENGITLFKEVKKHIQTTED